MGSMDDNKTGQHTAPQHAAPQGKTEARQRARARWRVIRWIIVALVVVAVVYFAIQVVMVMMPRMRTQVAILETMTDSVDVTGFVCLDSAPVQGADGSLYYLVPTGERVSAGTDIALVFSSEAAAEKKAELATVEKELALLEQARGTGADGSDVDTLLRQMNTGLTDYLNILEKGDYGSIEGAKDEIALAANKMQVLTGAATGFDERVAELQQQKSALETAAVSTGELVAGESGYFVPSSHYDRVMPDRDRLDSLSPEALRDLCGQPLADSGVSVAGHIIRDYKWQFYTTITAKQAQKFSEGMKLELAFPDTSEDTVPMRVETLTESGTEDGLVKVVLSCENISPEIMQMRLENAQVIFSTVKGLRVDKNALRVIEGDTCVYVKFGNQVYLRRVKVLLEDENYVLMSRDYEEGVNELSLYDEVVVDAGGVELYDKRVL